MIYAFGFFCRTFCKKARQALRKVSEDSDAAKLMGINVNMTISLTFAIGSALAAVAAVIRKKAENMQRLQLIIQTFV